jgi:FkbM family methyltransferase
MKSFLKRQKEFTGKIVAYKPDPKNHNLLKQYIINLDESTGDNVIYLPYAVGPRSEIVHFNATGTMGSTISNEGKTEVACVTLDENLDKIHTMPTYIKMDIEGWKP